MLNQLVIAGRLARDPEIINSDNGVEKGIVTLNVPRAFKNENGKYDTDIIKCNMFNAVASHVLEYCKKGDIIGIKGRIQSNLQKDKDENEEYALSIVAEKVTFLSKENIEKNYEREKER